MTSRLRFGSFHRNFKKNVNPRSTADIETCRKPPPDMNVTIAGANTDLGRLAAVSFLQLQPGIKRVFMYDKKGESEHTVKYLKRLDTKVQIDAGKGLLKLAEFLKKSRIVMICGALYTCPNESEECLFFRNADFVRQVVRHCAEYNPSISIAIVVPPVTSLVPMAAEIYRKAGVIRKNKIYGVMSGNVCRAKCVAAQVMETTFNELDVTVVGGALRRAAVTLLKPPKTPHNTLTPAWHERLMFDISEAEEDVLCEKVEEKIKSGALYYNTHAAVKFVTSLVNALNGQPVLECAFVKQPAPISEMSRFLATPVHIGTDGVKGTYIPPMSDLELQRLEDAVERIKHAIDLGEFYVTGDDSVILRRRTLLESAK